MQDVVDTLVRLFDRAGGSYVAALAEPFSHIATWLLVMLYLALGALAAGIAGRGLAALASGPGLAWVHTSFGDMSRVGRRHARLSWWAARPESLLIMASSPMPTAGTWQRLSDPRPAWVRGVGRTTRVIAIVARPAWWIGREVIRLSPAGVFAWIVTIAYLDRDLVRRLAPENLFDTLQANWAALPGIVTVAGAALALVLSLRRPRVRPRASHRLASEAACLATLARILVSLREAGYELWQVGSQGIPNLRQELVSVIDRVAHGACQLDEEFSIGLCSVRYRSTYMTSSSPSWRDLDALVSATSALACEFECMKRRGEMHTFWRLVGRAGHLRAIPLSPPSALRFHAERVSRQGVDELVRDERGLDRAERAFHRARSEPDPHAARRLEVEGAVELELAIRSIASTFRRDLATLAREVAEVDELYFRLQRRLHVGPVDRLIPS